MPSVYELSGAFSPYQLFAVSYELGPMHHVYTVQCGAYCTGALCTMLYAPCAMPSALCPLLHLL